MDVIGLRLALSILIFCVWLNCLTAHLLSDGFKLVTNCELNNALLLIVIDADLNPILTQEFK